MWEREGERREARGERLETIVIVHEHPPVRPMCRRRRIIAAAVAVVGKSRCAGNKGTCLFPVVHTIDHHYRTQ